MSYFIATLTDADTNTVLRAKRKSATKSYSHMVFVRMTPERMAKSAKATMDLSRDNLAYARTCLAAGETIYGVTGRPTVEIIEAYEAQTKRAAAAYYAATERGQSGPWMDGGWASRPDLATKNAAKWEAKGYEAVIVEAEPVDPKTYRAVSAVANA